MRFRVVLFFFFLFRIAAFAATDSTFVIREFTAFSSNDYDDPSVEITGMWRYMKGDDVRWADTAFGDSQWKLVPSELPLNDMEPGVFEGIGWFRKWIEVPSSYCNKPLGLMITQSGASEIYLDGKLIHKFGKIDSKNEERYDPQLLPVDILFDSPGPHLLAVRYANANAVEDARKGYNAYPGFTMRVGVLKDYATFHYVNSNILVGIFTFYFTFFSALAFLHLVIFLFNRKVKPNLYYSIFAGSFGLIFLCVLSAKAIMDPDSNSAL